MKKYISLIAITLGFCHATGQVVWEDHRAPVYGYLARMAQKGFVEFHDVIRPVDRALINACLDSLERKPLSMRERGELIFYKKEYSLGEPRDRGDQKNLEEPHDRVIQKGTRGEAQGTMHERFITALLRKDPSGRWRAVSIKNQGFKLNVDPLLGAKMVAGSEGRYREVSNGFNVWGNAGRFGFQLHYRDQTLTGTGLDKINDEGPQTAVISLINRDPKQRNFNTLKGHLTYGWKNGSISLGKDHFLWGYGEGGRIVMSDRAPTFTYLRLDYHPLPWLHFNWMHGWMNSGIVDSVRSYPTGTSGVSGDVRIRNINKYLAQHSLSILPLKGLSITLGESVMYSDKIDIGYFIPVMYYKAYDNLRSNYNINAGGNAQAFLQISSRNHLPKTHLYASWFVDELRLTKLFNPKMARNQFGYTLGINKTDLLLPYLTGGIEYTRINPFVYRNLLPAQDYLQEKFPLGDWMGSNSDRFMVFSRWNPIPKLRLQLQWHTIRKGGPGTLVQQYQAIPQPKFLFDYQKSRQDLRFTAQYEWINNLYFTLDMLQTKQRPVGLDAVNTNQVSLGFSYGL